MSPGMKPTEYAALANLIEREGEVVCDDAEMKMVIYALRLAAQQDGAREAALDALKAAWPLAVDAVEADPERLWKIEAAIRCLEQ